MGIVGELRRRSGDLVKANVGLIDKATGRAKSAAGDVLGIAGLRRQGAEEEAKGEAKEDLAEQRATVTAEEERAEEFETETRDRAADAARREFARAERAVSRKREQVDAEREQAEQLEDEVESLAEATDPDTLLEKHTRAELERRAAELGIEGRSRMSKEELAREIVARS